MLRLLPLLIALSWALPASAQPTPFDTLTVRTLTQAPETWIGAWPSDVFWTDAGDYLYFRWNPQGRFESDSLFRVAASGGEPERVPVAERLALAPRFTGFHADRLAYDQDLARRVYARDGDLWLLDIASNAQRRLVSTGSPVINPRFSPDGRRVVFVQGGNVHALDLEEGSLRRLTDLRSGSEDADPTYDEQQTILRDQQTELFDTIREAARRDSLREAAQERDRRARGLPPTLYTGRGQVQQLALDPTERFVTFVRMTPPDDARATEMSDYVTRDGQVSILTARPKVGSPGAAYAFVIQDLARDTSYTVDFTTLPGAFDPTDVQGQRGMTADSARVFQPFGPQWSPDGRFAVLDVRTRDNKDRWIVRLDPETGALTTLDRQRDEAWVAGPGIAWAGSASPSGWIPEADGSYRRFWFHSERTGTSHLYAADVETGRVQALTEGDFEVHDARLSRDGRMWLMQTNEGSPYEFHAYRMPVSGGTRERLTEATGRHEPAFHPDDRRFATLFSTSNRPPEVFLHRAGQRDRLTHSPTEAWLAYPWQEADIVTIPASDGAEVPARIFRPEDFGAEPNGAAVFFVHGAGYLQNVHRGWSTYFRETMFHHLLAARGYVVLDLDFRASAGYGRDWRTAVHRHMGGRDLQDYVDASRYVREQFGVAPERVGIYGGSYGGFITLMALFTEPEHFGAGAAMRSVTDWAHYNDPYTRNILGTPAEDPEAFRRSSPIYFADGLEDPLLMTHGLVDVNVQPQDIFRLSQRLIELGKEDWELAIHPVEDHGYTEPTSWADKLTRILDLFERSLR